MKRGKFSISESVFRFGADVRIGDDIREAQLRLIRDGEAVVHTKEPSQVSLLTEKNEESYQSDNVEEGDA